MTKKGDPHLLVFSDLPASGLEGWSAAPVGSHVWVPGINYSFADYISALTVVG